MLCVCVRVMHKELKASNEQGRAAYGTVQYTAYSTVQHTAARYCGVVQCRPTSSETDFRW